MQTLYEQQKPNTNFVNTHHICVNLKYIGGNPTRHFIDPQTTATSGSEIAAENNHT